MGSGPDANFKVPGHIIRIHAGTMSEKGSTHKLATVEAV